MNFTNKISIRLADVYNTSVSSRSSIIALLAKYREIKNIEIDLNFENISFVSRSTAQQIILERNLLKKISSNITFTNVSYDISLMLNVAENSKKNPPKIVEKEFATSQELETFMLSF